RGDTPAPQPGLRSRADDGRAVPAGPQARPGESRSRRARTGRLPDRRHRVPLGLLVAGALQPAVPGPVRLLAVGAAPTLRARTRATSGPRTGVCDDHTGRADSAPPALPPGRDVVK